MKQLIGIFIIAAISFSSCNGNEEMDMSGNDAHSLTLTYNIPDATVTRAADSYVKATGNESTVEGLYLLFFEADKHDNGAFVVAAEASLEGASLKQNSISVAMPGGIDEAKEYSILVIANLKKYETSPADYLATFANKTYSQAKEDLQMTLAINDDGRYKFPDGILPMSGTTVKPAGKSEMKVDLLRAAVRIDVAVSEGLIAAGVELKQVSLNNVAPTIPLYRTQREIAESRVNSEMLTVTDSKVTGGLYAVETYLDVSDDKILQRDATFLIVEVFDPSIHKDGDKDKTWYRIDLNIDVDRKQYLKRNNAYRVLITKINGLGASKPDEVENDKIIAVTVSIEWIQETLTGNNGNGYYEFQ